MKNKSKLQGSEIMKGLLLAQFIILFHVIIIAVLGITVLLLGGFAQNLIWIILGVVIFTLTLTYIIYRRVKIQGRDLLRNLDQSAAMRGRALEISFMGGVMSLKVGSSDALPALEHNGARKIHRLEDSETIRNRDLADLAQLLADDLISIEDYARAKQKILSTK
jgi:uncharacterized membrane protein